jgi:hypothetical protein
MNRVIVLAIAICVNAVTHIYLFRVHLNQNMAFVGKSMRHICICALFLLGLVSSQASAGVLIDGAASEILFEDTSTTLNSAMLQELMNPGGVVAALSANWVATLHVAVPFDVNQGQVGDGGISFDFSTGHVTLTADQYDRHYKLVLFFTSKFVFFPAAGSSLFIVFKTFAVQARWEAEIPLCQWSG